MATPMGRLAPRGAVSEEVKLLVLMEIGEKSGILVDGTDSGTDSPAGNERRCRRCRGLIAVCPLNFDPLSSNFAILDKSPPTSARSHMNHS